MTRRDALHYAAILATILAACILLSAMDAPRPRFLPVADRPKAAGETVRREVRWPEAEPVSLSNPTPLSDELYRAVLIACDTYDVPECLALGLIEVESSFDAEAVSSRGCYGLCQLNPQYHPGGLTPAENIAYGLSYLGGLLERYGDVGAALTAYNAGHDTGGREYAGKVLEAAERWEEVYTYALQN